MNFISFRYVSFKNNPEPKKSDFEKSNLKLHSVPTNIKIQEIKSIGNALCNIFTSPLMY